MSTYTGLTFSREESLIKYWRNHPATRYAWSIGEAVCDRLRRGVRKGMTLKKAISQNLRKEGFKDVYVKIARGEVHVYIGSLKDRLHGHVIVPIRRKIARYHRGYAAPRGYWNHSR